MKNVLSLTKRNLLLFFRNKSVVFFSFLSVIIILGLYILFLSDLQVQNIKQAVGDVKGAAALVNSWVMAGLIAVSTVTLSLGALGQIVDDKEKRAIDDFLVSPVKRMQVFLSYILSTIIITMLLSVILIIIAEFYIVKSGGVILNVSQILQVLGVVVICVLSSSVTMLFVVSFLKNEKALGVFSTVVGTMIGFVTGAYVPIGIMPDSVQIVSNLIPVSQGAALLRKVFLDQPLTEVFANAPQAMSDFTKMQGVDLYLGKTELTTNFMVIYIIGSILIFAVINIIRFKRMKNS